MLTIPHTFTWVTKWFKSIVAYTKCHHDSYGSELGCQAFFLGSRISTSLGIGVFVWFIYYIIYALFIYFLARMIIQSLGFLLVSFTFIGNKCN